MTYEEALKISPYIEGCIKCTYARFYYDYDGLGEGSNEDIKHLFSFQRQKIEKDIVHVQHGNKLSQEIVNWGYFSGETPTPNGSSMSMGPGLSHSTTMGLYVNLYSHEIDGYGLAVVHVDPEWKKEVSWGRKTKSRLVRVKIEEPIANSLIQLMSENGKHAFDYVTNRILDTANLYVKEDAFDWFPIDTRTLDQSIEKTVEDMTQTERKKVQRKRNILLIAAAASLLLK